MENWFRLQTPPPEPFPTQLPGITVALPDTPARLSRSTALRRAFDVFRPSYPPALPPAAAPQPGDESAFSYVPPPEVQRATLVWQPRSLFVSQSVVGQRVQRGLLALYVFQEAPGARTVRDVSGVGPELSLTIRDPNRVTWLPGGGAQISAPNRMSSAQAATKLFDGCRATNAITIEAWVRPANITQRGPARIISLSADTNRRNVTLGQGLRDTNLPADVYEVRLRTSSTSQNGRPALATTASSARTELTHIVFTRTSDGTATLYINGVAQVPGSYPTPPDEQHYHQGQVLGTFQNWERTFRLHLGNELTDDRPWLGEYYLVALYNQAFSHCRSAASPIC